MKLWKMLPHQKHLHWYHLDIYFKLSPQFLRRNKTLLPKKYAGYSCSGIELHNVMISRVSKFCAAWKTHRFLVVISTRVGEFCLVWWAFFGLWDDDLVGVVWQVATWYWSSCRLYLACSAPKLLNHLPCSFGFFLVYWVGWFYGHWADGFL